MRALRMANKMDTPIGSLSHPAVESGDTRLEYWQRQLAGTPQLLQLPTDRPRPGVYTDCRRRLWFLLSSDIIAPLTHLTDQAGTTLVMALLAGFAVILHRYSGQSDIVIGALDTSFKLANSRPLRIQIEANLSFQALLHQVRATAQAAANNPVELEQILNTLQLQRNRSHAPLFQAIVIWPDPQVDGSQSQTLTSQYDIALLVRETAQGWEGTWDYNADLFGPATIERMSGHFQVVLTAVTKDPEHAISDIPILTELERHQLLSEWNDTATDYPQDCIHQLFEAQVSQDPDAIAVVCGDQQLSYGELNTRANQLAHYLRSLGVQPEEWVGVCIERSVDMVVGVLGILKAGGAYVPLDPEYPQERLTMMMTEAQMRFLVSKQEISQTLVSSAGSLQIVCLDADWPVISQESALPLDNTTTSDSLIYAIFTSGSTGKPKGAGVFHKGFVNLVSWYIEEFQLAGNTLLISSLSFDLTQKNVFAPLCLGSTLYLASPGAYDPYEIVKQVDRHQISWLNCTPTAFNLILLAAEKQGYRDLSPLRHVFLGGEPIQVPSLEPWLLSPLCQATVVNSYGPTECTDVCTFHRLSLIGSRDRASVPIGKPIWNTQLFVLNNHRQLQPIGVAGELYIGGAGVGFGYFNSPEKTRQQFVQDPQLSAGYLYKTGDLVRYLPDGSIEFLGRIDHQVKISGFRIELGEIESALNTHPHVQQAVVTVREDEPGQKRLVAYVVWDPGASVSSGDLRPFLQGQLPDYMVPAIVVELEAFPLTPSGKVDRRALPPPSHERPALSQPYVAPQTELHTQLANLWSQLLLTDPIGIKDNFFELGGSSVLSLRLVEAMQTQLGMTTTPVKVYENPTIEQLALTLSQADPGPSSRQQFQDRAQQQRAARSRRRNQR